MQLPSRLRKQKHAVRESEVLEIQERVRAMRNHLVSRDLELADLFALLAEDERPALQEMRKVQPPEVRRFWPDQIPARAKPAVEQNDAETTYGDWELLRRKSLLTLP